MYCHKRENIVAKGFEFTGITLTEPYFNQMNIIIPASLNIMPSELTAFRIAAEQWEVYYIPSADKTKEYQESPILPL